MGYSVSSFKTSASFSSVSHAVAPTFERTPFTEKRFEDEEFKKHVIDSIPLGRMATNDEVAYATRFLASDLADMITGHILTVDGGWTIKRDAFVFVNI
jgi:NAD(P)-dependent dehydrogenase (short-subunit alcohol dehydrogenase family)